MIHPGISSEFSRQAKSPEIDSTAFIHPLSLVAGDVRIGRDVMVAPFSSVRGDEGKPICIGDASNVQDGVVIHGLETEKDGVAVEKNRVVKDGRFYSVYVGSRVSLAHQAQLHGPCLVDDDTFVGMQSFVFMSTVGKGCVLEPRAMVIGVTVGSGRYVPAGHIVQKQEDADLLPEIEPDYRFAGINRKVVQVNTALARGYRKSLGSNLDFC